MKGINLTENTFYYHHFLMIVFSTANLWRHNNEICGISPYHPNGKIVGGNDVHRTRVWPWLGYLLTPFGRFCTVELISWRWATTAAHCM